MRRIHAAVLVLVCGVACAGAVPWAQAASYRVLYSFQARSDGAYPESSLLNLGGTLYGTTLQGGASGYGTVFALNLTTGAETVVYSFPGGKPGGYPIGTLIKVGAKLEGTTDFGGSSAACVGDVSEAGTCGTVFSLNPTNGAEEVVYSFRGGSDGARPNSLINVGGTLYGTTAQGDGSDNCGYGAISPGCGTVFSLSPRTGAENVAFSFNGLDGQAPAGLVNVGGLLYGVAGGGRGYGTVFSLDPATGTETTVYYFQGGSDGNGPQVGMIKVGTKLYGTTDGGGGSANCGSLFNAPIGCGTVFSLNPTTGAEEVVYSFQGRSDGDLPAAGLVKVGAKLYGTTLEGGPSGSGTVFSVNPTTWVEKVLHSFSGGSDGSLPRASLVNVGGTLYGTTFSGGSSNFGTVFAITP